MNVQLWDREVLVSRGQKLPIEPLSRRAPERFEPRRYQEDATDAIVQASMSRKPGSALVVLATGLGKTWVAAETVRRLCSAEPSWRVLVVAHTNDLVYQLERAFWPFLRIDQTTAVINGFERPKWTDLDHYSIVFASRDSLVPAMDSGISLPDFDMVIVDECHHLGSNRYESMLDYLAAGRVGGPFLLGLTATPWRPGGEGLDHRFDAPVVNKDLVEGLRSGFLANVDYRMYMDNVDWRGLQRLRGDRFTPRAINRTLFIDQWDDAVIERTREAWAELQQRGRGIVFCGTVEHAERVSARINALGFASARPIYSRASDGVSMGPIDRAKLLLDFADGRVQILCAVDVLNEGVDVPDVNLLVFQRVTHSRRIFVQQLGRGLRLAPGKERVLVLDFVSDVRRFAAGLELQQSLEAPGPRSDRSTRVSLPSRVSFRRADAEDIEGASFLRHWLGELQEVEEAGEDVSVLRFPPIDLLSDAARNRG
nr:DEAD/DEAH box helicase [Geodermatophilus obscurus]